MIRRLVLVLALLLLAAFIAAWFLLPPYFEKKMAGVIGPPVEISANARRLHSTLRVTDLHADALIWKRDLLARNARGQVDVPRLQEGNVAVQLFTVPTVFSAKRANRSRGTGLNTLTLASVLRPDWPKAWFRLDARAFQQAARLRAFAERSNDSLVLLRTRADLARHLEARRGGSRSVGALLGIEGAHAMEGDLDNVDAFYDAGYRVIGLLHHFDNEIGGSSTGIGKGGLTPFGRELVARLDRRGFILDLAHASPAVIAEVTKMTSRPVIVSHTGVRGTCDRDRNLPDASLRQVAATGGVIGIGFWPGAVCGVDADAIARAIAHAASVAGVDHVALGSDFDGDSLPFDAAHIAQITDALLRAGMSEPAIRKVMGENTLRVLAQSLP